MKCEVCGQEAVDWLPCLTSVVEHATKRGYVPAAEKRRSWKKKVASHPSTSTHPDKDWILCLSCKNEIQSYVISHP